jgi:hypothetical protein
VRDEEYLACLLRERLRLNLPVNIAEVARNYCDLEWDDIPLVDGVVIRKISLQRPLIVLARHKPYRRERFTLAHELGHALIPWHVGVMTCHTDRRSSDPEEIEANRFASELLVPRAYVELQSRALNVKDLIEHLSEAADVSKQMAFLSVLRALETILFVAVDDTNRVSAAFNGSKCPVGQPDEGIVFDSKCYSRGSIARGIFRDWEERQMWWFQYVNADVAPPDPQDSREAKEVKEGILRDLGITGSERTNLLRILSGVVGGNNSKLAHDAEEKQTAKYLASFLKTGIIARPGLEKFQTHPDFDTYIWKHAEPIICGRPPVSKKLKLADS